MAKRTIRRPRAVAAGIGALSVSSAAPADTLATIFASIRTGEAPWSLDELPTDTGATTVLLSELDRLWQNPLPN
jgi:hypothetical protein